MNLFGMPPLLGGGKDGLKIGSVGMLLIVTEVQVARLAPNFIFYFDTFTLVTLVTLSQGRSGRDTDPVAAINYLKYKGVRMARKETILTRFADKLLSGETWKR